MSHENIIPSTTDYSLTPRLSYFGKLLHWKIVYFAAVKLTKNANIDKYKYSRYGIGFDRKGIFPTLVVELVEV